MKAQQQLGHFTIRTEILVLRRRGGGNRPCCKKTKKNIFHPAFRFPPFFPGRCLDVRPSCYLLYDLSLSLSLTHTHTHLTFRLSLTTCFCFLFLFFISPTRPDLLLFFLPRTVNNTINCPLLSSPLLSSPLFFVFLFPSFLSFLLLVVDFFLPFKSTQNLNSFLLNIFFSFLVFLFFSFLFFSFLFYLS